MLTLAAPLVRLALLAGGVCHEARHLGPSECMAQTVAAVQAETDDISAPELLALAYRESRYSNAARPGCGVVQVRNLSARSCRLARSSALHGYHAGARRYGEWVAICQRWGKRDVPRCARQGYAEGTKAAKRGYGVKCSRGRRRCDRGASIQRRARRIAAWRPRAEA